MGWLDSVLDLFRRKASSATIPPPAYPLGRPPQVGAADADDMMRPFDFSALDHADWPRGPDPIPLIPALVATTTSRASRDNTADFTCMISYVDASERRTTRRITIGRVTSGYDTVYIRAHCHERDADRTFRLDRIQECWDCDTGEIIDLAAYVDSVIGIVPPTAPTANRVEMEIGISSPDGYAPPSAPLKEIKPRSPVRQEMVQRCGDGLRVLKFFALCDGASHAAEERELVDYARKLCDGRVVGWRSTPCDDDFVREFSRRLRPTPESMLAAFGAIAGTDATHAAFLFQKLGDLILADGTVHPHEQHFFDELQGVVRQMKEQAEAAGYRPSG